MEPEIFSGLLGIIITIFSVILFVLWFLLPFAVFGIKGRIDELISQNNQIIELLQNTSNTSRKE